MIKRVMTYSRLGFYSSPSIPAARSFSIKQFTFGSYTPYMQHNPMLRLQMRTFSAGVDLMFGTETPSKSNRYQRGLYHRKTHGQRFQRCFSMKKSIITKKPNV
jgi:hypothetical protein